jgi:hypothetical protein
MYEMDQCSHVFFAEKFVSRFKPFSNGNVLKLRVQGIKRPTQLKKLACLRTMGETNVPILLHVHWIFRHEY